LIHTHNWVSFEKHILDNPVQTTLTTQGPFSSSFITGYKKGLKVAFKKVEGSFVFPIRLFCTSN
jgi:hypothetical protein